MKALELEGRKIGKLTVMRRVPESSPIKWECICDCGKTAIVFGGNLTRANPTQSCGCLKPPPPIGTKHGLSRTKIYRTYHAILQRCYNPNHPDYHSYGGRGITVCDEWRDPETGFARFLADMGEQEDGMTIERLDNSLGYFKANCEWRTMKVQSRNKRSNRFLTRPSDGKTQCCADWAEELGLHRSQIGRRLAEGWSMEDALSKSNSPAQRDLETGEFLRVCRD